MAREIGDYIESVSRMMKAAGRRVGQADDADLAKLMETMGQAWEDTQALAVAGLRAQEHSWAYIGRAMGISRQAAQQRWGKDEPVH